jgi:hypothetical protein
MEQLWVVYNVNVEFGDNRILGVVDSLDKFKDHAKALGITSEPILDEFGTGSMHYEYIVNKGIYAEYYMLVAEPFIKNKIGK